MWSYNKSFRLILLLSVLANVVYPVHAQMPILHFDHITVEEGLSQSTVFAITQDDEGFIWFGTRDGLNRYDSRKIVVYRHHPARKNSISNNTIYSLRKDSKERLWIGTNNGLNLYHPESDNFERIYFEFEENQEVPPPDLLGNIVTAILEDDHQRIWVGTRNGLYLLIEGNLHTVQSFVHDPQNSNSLVNNDIRSLFQDRDGILWIGTSSGLARLQFEDLNHYQFASYEIPYAGGDPVRGNWINAFAEDYAGRLLIGTEKGGLNLFDKVNGKFIAGTWNDKGELDVRAVRTIVRSEDGNFWIGTIGGLFILTPDALLKYKNIPDNVSSISDNSVRSIFIDASGVYWIGTFHGGVNIYSPLSKQFSFLKPGMDRFKLPFKVAGALLTDKHDNIWIGTEGHGLIFINRRTNQVRHFKNDPNNTNSLNYDNIKSLLLDDDRGIWIGTIKGLDYFDFKRNKFTHLSSSQAEGNSGLPEDAIYYLMKAPDGKVWVSTYRNGLYLFDPRLHVIHRRFNPIPDIQTSLSAAGVTSLHQDSEQNLWVGTVSGLNKKKFGKQEFQRFMNDSSDSLSISGDYIQCIFEDSKKRVWVGTRGDGLNLLLQDGRTFKRFSTHDGLPGNTIYGILEDSKGFLWLSSENGLTCLNPENFIFKNFNRNDGLVCQEFNHNSYFVDQHGVMYFGGYNGVVYFHPGKIRVNKKVPEIVFTGLKLFNKEVKVDPSGKSTLDKQLRFKDELQFRHNQNVFSLEFAVLNFINPHKNLYAYKLEGFENEWNFVREPVATYMNLKPGNYTLLAKGANNDGIWNEQPVSIRLNVLPPPWKTWWAYSIYITAFVGLLFIWAHYNKKQVRLEHDLQLEHMEKIKQEELHQAKLNFFTNVAHEIRTPLTLISGPIDLMLESRRTDRFLRYELTQVKSNSDRLMRLINQLLDFQRQETGNVKLAVREGNIVRFAREILFSFREYAELRKVSLEFNTDKENIPLWFDADELAKVFSNLLFNAFKFTPGGGKISISVSHEHSDTSTDDNSRVKITVEDTGLGIPKVHLKNIFHRFYQAENSGHSEAGFGIGLALSKSIVDLHHGEILVSSREATPEVFGFTRFTLILPCGKGHFSHDQICEVYQAGHEEKSKGISEEIFTEASEMDENGTIKQADERPLILIVEDNEEIRGYISRLLKQQRYEVIESANGEEGWGKASEQLPDLILSDIMMPVKDGLHLVRQIKADERTNHIPIILLTARSALNHQIEGLDIGADDYLTKPFSLKLLLTKIRNHLNIREKLKEKYSRMVTLQPQYEELDNPDDKFLSRLMKVLDENISLPEFNVSGLVREIGMSRPVLFRKIKMLTGLSVIDLIRSVRMKKAEMLLRQRKLSISEIAFSVGFSDPKYFSKTFREQFGKSPSQYVEEMPG